MPPNFNPLLACWAAGVPREIPGWAEEPNKNPPVCGVAVDVTFVVGVPKPNPPLGVPPKLNPPVWEAGVAPKEKPPVVPGVAVAPEVPANENPVGADKRNRLCYGGYLEPLPRRYVAPIVRAECSVGGHGPFKSKNKPQVMVLEQILLVRSWHQCDQ